MGGVARLALHAPVLELVHMIVFGIVLFELGMASLWLGVAWVVALVVVVVIVVRGLPWS